MTGRRALSVCAANTHAVLCRCHIVFARVCAVIKYTESSQRAAATNVDGGNGSMDYTYICIHHNQRRPAGIIVNELKTVHLVCGFDCGQCPQVHTLGFPRSIRIGHCSIFAR